MKEFENLVQKYKATPWKSELLKHFIEVEDTANLQKITDLSSEIHGERNSLCDLAFMFIECGRPIQAKKILEVSSIFRNRLTQYYFQILVNIILNKL